MFFGLPKLLAIWSRFLADYTLPFVTPILKFETRFGARFVSPLNLKNAAAFRSFEKKLMGFGTV